MTDGGIATPDAANMELRLQYNYTSLSDASAGVARCYRHVRQYLYLAQEILHASPSLYANA